MLENYYRDSFGVVHQKSWKPKTYDKQYLSYYDGLRDRTIKLGYQRWGWVLGLLGQCPDSVFEIGYGTGTFLEAAAIGGVSDCCGYDIARYPLPNHSDFIEWDSGLARSWELTAMFDVLEHIPDLSFLGQLRTNHLVVAVPHCRLNENGDAWFARWRMRLPDEHLHHFDVESLITFLEHYGFAPRHVNCFEDGLQNRDGETSPNILCGFFSRK